MFVAYEKYFLSVSFICMLLFGITFVKDHYKNRLLHYCPSNIPEIPDHKVVLLVNDNINQCKKSGHL